MPPERMRSRWKEVMLKLEVDLDLKTTCRRQKMFK